MALANRKKLDQLPIDETFIIFGPEASGKTVAASTFPKPMLYLDIKEGGTGSIPRSFRDRIEVVQIESYEDLLTTYMEIFALPRGTYASIVTDSGTNVEELIKDYLKQAAGKASMNQDLWGKVNEQHAYMASLMRQLHYQTGAKTITIYHEREFENKVNPELTRVGPSITPKASRQVCAKTSYIWYLNVEHVQVLGENNDVSLQQQFYAIIDAHPGLSTKCRKPPYFTKRLPSKLYNITYDRFKTEVLDKINGVERTSQPQ